MKVITKVTSFFKANKCAFYVTILAIIFACINFWQFNNNQTLEKQLMVSEQNLAAANDTLRFTKALNGQREANILAFWTNKASNLEKINADLYKEVKNTKGTVSTIIKGGIEIIHDTTYLTAETIPPVSKEDIIKTSFSFDSTYSPGNFRNLAGYTQYNPKDSSSKGVLLKDNIGMTFVTGVKNLDKNKPEIFLRSNYPGFEVLELQGAVLDPNLFKPKKKAPLFIISATVGWVPVTYNVFTKQTEINFQRIGFSAGVGLNIGRLLKK